MTNKLAEILAASQGVRLCLRGHGVMERQPGLWVAQQVARDGPESRKPGTLRLTGQLLTTHLHVCPECGSVEFVDERAA